MSSKSAHSNGGTGEASSIETELTACAAINSPDEWVDLHAKVLELWEPGSDSIAQVGLLGDSSGVIKFVAWKKSELPELEEGEAYSFENVVTDKFEGKTSVKLNSNTTVEPIDGEAAERDALAADLPTTVGCGTISSSENWLDVRVEVDQLWEPHSDSIAQVGLLADSSGRVKFTAWETSNLPALEEGEIYDLENVVTDEYEGKYSVKLTSTTEITQLTDN
jgi:replication factor A1